MRKPARPLLLALLPLLLLPGCGGGGEEDATTASAAAGGGTAVVSPAPEEQAAAARSHPGEKKDGAEQQRPSSRGEGGGAAPQDAAPRHDGQQTAAQHPGPAPGTKSPAPGVPVQAGGDNSIQKFGVEGGVDEREQALVTLRAYLNALVDEQWPQACAETSHEFKEQLTQMMAANPAAEQGEGCAGSLPRIMRYGSMAELRAAAGVDELLSFRVEGGYAYAIFEDAEGKVSFIAMADDDGTWKVNTVAPAPFPQAP